MRLVRTPPRCEAFGCRSDATHEAPRRPSTTERARELYCDRHALDAWRARGYRAEAVTPIEVFA